MPDFLITVVTEPLPVIQRSQTIQPVPTLVTSLNTFVRDSPTFRPVPPQTTSYRKYQSCGDCTGGGGGGEPERPSSGIVWP